MKCDLCLKYDYGYHFRHLFCVSVNLCDFLAICLFQVFTVPRSHAEFKFGLFYPHMFRNLREHPYFKNKNTRKFFSSFFRKQSNL